jgi:4-amino-4-deoxy-L-arabinose transferase-like glycosyltransferase
MPSGLIRRLTARNGGRLGLAALVAILLLGLGLRLDYAIEGRAPVYDAKAYARIAAHLEAGDGFTAGRKATQPSTNYSPGLPLLVAGIYELTGGVNGQLARIVLAVIASLAVLFTYLLGRRLGGVVAGLIGAVAVAVYPALLEYGGMLMSEPLAATLLSAGVLALLWAGDAGGRLRSSWWRWLLAGLLFGGLSLVRPEYLAVSFFLALLILARAAGSSSGARGTWRRSLAQAALVALGIVVAVAPWTIRNAVELHRFVPVSTGGGQVLFSGTYLPSGGDPERVGAEVVERHPELFAPAAVHNLRLEQILARLAHHRYPELEADETLSKMGKEQLWNDVSEEPLEYAGFLATKIGRIWSHGPRDVMRDELPEALHWALLGFGLLGLAVLAWKRRWEALVIAAVFLAITVISAVLVASPRRVLPLLPLLAACAGFGAVWLDERSLRLGPSGQIDPQPDPEPSPGRTSR